MSRSLQTSPLASRDEHVSLSFFFFFQAEDGIRDLTVTGVQTCALPILRTAAVLAGLTPSSNWGTVGTGPVTWYPGNPHTVSPALWVSSRRRVTFSVAVKRESGSFQDLSLRLMSSSRASLPCSTSASTPDANTGLLIDPARNSVVVSTASLFPNSFTP